MLFKPRDERAEDLTDRIATELASVTAILLESPNHNPHNDHTRIQHAVWNVPVFTPIRVKRIANRFNCHRRTAAN
jgi:hypothetical protein